MSEFKKVENTRVVCIAKTDSDEYESTTVRVTAYGETLSVKIINNYLFYKRFDTAFAELTRKDVEAMLALFDN